MSASDPFSGKHLYSALAPTLVLTPQAIVDAAPGHVAAVRRHMIDLMTDEEIDVLATFSRRIVDRLSAIPS